MSFSTAEIKAARFKSSFLEAIKIRSKRLKFAASAAVAASTFDLATSRPLGVRGAGTGVPEDTLERENTN